MSHDNTAVALMAFFQPGDVFEIRALDATRPGYRRPHIESGYFDYEHIEDAVKAIAELDSAKGIYFTPNPVNPALLARAANRIRPSEREPTTSDADIPCRRWLLIDCDPIRPSGISSSDEEHDLALAKAFEIRDGLSSMGWPEPLICDSGNGGQLMYRINLAAEDNGLVHACLQALLPAGDDQVEIDQAVHNPARIWRLPGTWNRKGDDLPARPHRLARIVKMPSKLTPVSGELLANLAAKAAHAPTQAHSGDTFAGVDITAIAGPEPAREAPFDLDKWIAKYCPEVEEPQPYNNGRKWVFPVCPFNSAHTNRSAVIIQNANGVIGFKCHHNGCSGYGWKDLRDLKELCDETVKVIARPSENQVKANSLVLSKPEIIDPGRIPDHLLHVPGIINMTMDYIDRRSVCPQPILALAACLPFVGTIAGRKVRDPTDTRTNLYAVGLAESGAGKNAAREAIKKIMYQAGADHLLGPESFASGAGVRSSIAAEPAQLCLVDEMGRFLKTLSNAQRAPYLYDVISTWMKLFTSSAGIYKSDGYADRSKNVVIDQPCLSLYGTTVPQAMFDAMNEESITEGFVGRLLIFQTDDNDPAERDPEAAEPPMDLLATVKAWVEFKPSALNLAGGGFNEHPLPLVLPYTSEALNVIDDLRRRARAEREGKSEVVRALWKRTVEHARKLALVYACSAQAPTRPPLIDAAAATWASGLAEYVTRKTVWLTHERVASSFYDAQCQRTLRAIRSDAKSNGGKARAWMVHRRLRKHIKGKERDALIQDLAATGEIKIQVAVTNGAPATYYIPCS